MLNTFLKSILLLKYRIFSISNGITNRQAGMTYVELIVVLSIFGIMSSIVMFNYNDFQAKIDIKNLANDIALQIVKAQKSAVNGQYPPSVQLEHISNPETWKPSYGVYFDTSTSTTQKSFYYFVDLNSDTIFDDSSCPGVDECLDKITMMKGDHVSKISGISGSDSVEIVSPLSITFKRPDSGAVFAVRVDDETILELDMSSVQITISSRKDESAIAEINVYSSGRIEIK